MCRLPNGFNFFFAMKNIISPVLCTSSFFPNREIGIFEVPLISYFIKLWRDSLGHSMLVGERGTQFLIKLPVFKKRNVHIYVTILCQFKKVGKNCKMFMGLCRLPDTPTIFGTSLTCFPISCFAQILFSSEYVKLFSQSLIIAIFFYFWGRPWYFACAWRLHCIPYLVSLSFV